jgi:DNA repair exonuclease SbcCD ATPase subunit
LANGVAAAIRMPRSPASTRACQNFRGIPEARIDISPIALITGHNYAGKTSIARAIAAAVTGRPIPYDKVAKKDCGVILRHGAKAGAVILSTEKGNTSVTWPKAEVSSATQRSNRDGRL